MKLISGLAAVLGQFSIIRSAINTLGEDELHQDVS